METTCNFIELNTVRTERLILRFLEKDDTLALFHLRNNKEVNKHLDREPPSHISQVSEFILKMNHGIAENRSLFWAITSEQDGLIGTICLWNFTSDKCQAEIGYELLPVHQGKGLVSEAVHAVTTLGFSVLNLKKITAWTTPSNSKSVNLLLKKGFTRDLVAEESIKSTDPGYAIYTLNYNGK